MLITVLTYLSVSFYACTDPLDNLRKSVFKIRTQSQDPDYLIPWQKDPVKSSSGTGFYIGNNRILTNAHVVANSKFVTVQRDGEAKKVSVQVDFIAHDCDLAILKSEDSEFFSGVEAMEIGSLPKLRTPVATIGYPTGGDQVSITEGVVSRIDFRRYAHGGYLDHVLIQVDSAINPGNSGGPVVQDNKVVGVAFQSYTAAENTGYIIPAVVINRFLDDIKDGVYHGHPTNEVVSYSDLLSNSAMRSYFGLDSERGVLVTHVPKYSPFHGIFKIDDILLSVNQNQIGSDGKIVFHGERVNFEVIYDLSQIGETVKFEILRDRKVETVGVPVAKSENFYQAGDLFMPFPKFYSYGGFIFTTLSRNLLKSWGRNWYDKSPIDFRFFHYSARLDPEYEDYEEYVVLIKRLSAPINQYIFAPSFAVVKDVNGKDPKNINEFKDLIENEEGKFINISMFFNESKIVLPANIQEVNSKINSHYDVQPSEWLGQYDRDTTTEWKITKNAKAH